MFTCLQRQISKKIFKFKPKMEACPVNAGHYMAYKHLVSFATDWAAIFGCDWFRIMPDIDSKLLRAAMKSLCCLIPQIGYRLRVLDLQLCTRLFSEHAVLFVIMFTQRPMNDWKIEQSNRHCFGCQQLLANSIENFTLRKKMTRCCQISTTH